MTARNEREGRAAAERLETEGIDVGYRPLDVSSPSSIAALAKELIADDTKLSVLVNNAGIALDYDGFNSEVARRTIETNFLGPLRVTDGLLNRSLPAGASSWSRAVLASFPAFPSACARNSSALP